MQLKINWKLAMKTLAIRLINQIILVITCFMLNIGIGQAASWCEWNKELGWNFYCEKEKLPKVETPTAPAIPPEQQARQELTAIQEKLEALKVLAILHPTPDNLQNYMTYQQEQVELASVFSERWRSVLWQTPDLDYTIRKPVMNLALTAQNQQRREDSVNLLLNLNKRYGLFFFFAQYCGPCHVYSPILKAFADTYGISVMAISMDGGSLPEWPAAVLNQGHAQKLGLTSGITPATILFDTVTKQALPVGYGAMSQSDLMERIYVVTQKPVGTDY